jgi:hypothetical protein
MISRTKEYKAEYWKKWRDKNRPLKTKRCEICGDEFSPHGPQKRCDTCRHVKCEYCGTLFIPGNSTLKHRYCSRICKSASQKGEEPIHLQENRGKKPRTYHLTKRDKHGNIFDREWRVNVFVRDNYTCQKCGKQGGRLHAHHIKPYKANPELRHDIDNGQTLCVACHKETDSYGWKNYHKNYRS